MESEQAKPRRKKIRPPRGLATGRGGEREQITVRADKFLLELCRNKAEMLRALDDHNSFRLTDMVEQGLWLWVRSQGEIRDFKAKGPFLTGHIARKLSREMRVLTLCFWAFITTRQPDYREKVRQIIEGFLYEYRNDEKYAAALARLAEEEPAEETPN